MNASDITCQDNLNAAQGLTGDRGITGAQGGPGRYSSPGIDGTEGTSGSYRVDISFSSIDDDQISNYPTEVAANDLDTTILRSPYILPYKKISATTPTIISNFIFRGTDSYTPTTVDVSVSWDMKTSYNDTGLLSAVIQVRDLTNNTIITNDLTLEQTVADAGYISDATFRILTNTEPLSNLPATESVFAITANIIYTGIPGATIRVHSFQMY